MGFFSEFNAWLSALLLTYISDNTARIAAALEPAVVTLATVYVMVWGYLHLTGQIEEPFVAGLKRIVALAVFLLALSRIALSVLLALGPFFVALLLFESSKRFFGAWLAQLANYAFITILTVLVAALMLALLSTAAREAASTGGGIQIAQAVRVCMAAGLTLLVMRQVMPMAAGLASGLALSTFGTLSATLAWAFGRASRGGGQFGRGLTDRETSRWDSFGRKAGYYTRQGLAAGWRRLVRRPNQIRA